MISFLAPCAGFALTLEELVQQPDRWPKEVRVIAATKAVQLKGDQVSGATLLGAGKELVVTGISVDGITGHSGSMKVRVPVEKTDLLARVNGPASAAPETPQPALETPPATPAPAARVAAPTSSRPSIMQRRLAGKLVRLGQNGSLQPVDAGQLAQVRYYALYYSASWCGPCRQFTPQFVQAYRQIKQQHPDFEVVFISADRSSGAMRDYMKEDRMPWLALKYDAAQEESELRRYCGPGIPCLVLVDPQGRVVSDSFEGDNYVGPGKVLNDAIRLLQQNG